MFELLQSSARPRDGEGLARAVEGLVRDGRLRPGDRLPTVRGLAAEARLSPTTVAAAYGALARRGVVRTDGRRGTRVAARPPLALGRPEPTLAPGLRDLAVGSPDPEFLPGRRSALRTLPDQGPLYGSPAAHPELVALARRDLRADRIPDRHVTIVSGAMDGIERVLQAHLRPGDRVAVEDPGYTAVLDLVGALGLQAEPVALDAYGPLPRSLEAALSRGAAAFVLTPRAQNPTGAALSAERARALAAVFARHPEALVVEDDHAGPVAGAPAATTAPPGHPRWAVVRSVSKWLGPDLRVAFLAGDEATVSRVEGRQALGSGWVSHLLQGTVARLWQSSETGKRLQQAATLYARRREALIEALRRRRIEAAGRSGLNVWIPVPEEASVVSALAGRGFAVRAGEPYRIASAPAIRVTTAALDPRDAERFASALAEVLRPRVRGAFV